MNPKRVLIHAWVVVTWRMIKIIPYLTIVAMGVLAYLLLAYSEENGAFGLSQAAWFATCGSVFASFVFMCLQIITGLLKDATPKSFENIYNDLVADKGLCAVHFQRGSDILIKEYQEKLKNASSRVWAIGITNRHLLNQHLSSIMQLISTKKIDVMIAFWNPETEIVLSPGTNKKTYKAVDFHSLIEHGTQSSYSELIQNQQKNIKDKTDAIKNTQGHIRVLSLSTLTNFTCFIIDDDLYFFPFLARAVESTNDPTIHCSVQTGLGKIIIQHFEQLFTREEASVTFFERKPGGV